MTILITGANGTVSSALLRSLDTSTTPVRVLVRDPGKAPADPNLQVVVGDLDQPETLEPAFAGVETVWLLNAMGPSSPHASSNAVWAARHAGVKHIVRLSAAGAAYDAPTRNGRLHAMSDAELMATDIGWTVVRPLFFMQNLLGSVAGDTLYGALGEARLGMIDVRDIADFSARILTAPQAHAGKVYTLTGPASISLREVAADAAAALGRPVSYQPVSPQDARAAMVAAGMPEWNAAVNAEYLQAYSGGWGDYATADFSAVTGRPARSFAEFARDHRDLLAAG